MGNLVERFLYYCIFWSAKVSLGKNVVFGRNEEIWNRKRTLLLSGLSGVAPGEGWVSDAEVACGFWLRRAWAT